MAYSRIHRMMVAAELARAGGNVPDAIANLRSRYKSFARLSEKTVRGMLDDPEFADAVALRAKEVDAAVAKVLSDHEVSHQRQVLADELRARRKAAPGARERLRSEVALMEGLRREIEARLITGADVGNLPAAWQKVAHTIESRPAVTEKVIRDRAQIEATVERYRQAFEDSADFKEACVRARQAIADNLDRVQAEWSAGTPPAEREKKAG